MNGAAGTGDRVGALHGVLAKDYSVCLWGNLSLWRNDMLLMYNANANFK